MSESTGMERLSHRDVERLLAEPSETGRARMIEKVGSAFAREKLTANERRLAAEIIGMMARDAALTVRRALAESVAQSRDLPRDVALQLARDVEAVALPILRFSEVLNDDDLVALVESGDESRQQAIAGREHVSERVTDCLIERGNEAVVATLMGNQTAHISDQGLARALDRFPESDAVKEPMVKRRVLPVAIAERLVHMVSEKLRDHLVTHHELPKAIASDLILQSRERAIMNVMSRSNSDADVRALVLQLKENGRLTHSLILRALCMGDLAFFEISLSVLAQVPLSNARMLIADRGPLGLKSIMARAGLPGSILPAVRVALDVARDTPIDNAGDDLAAHRQRIVERILTQFEGLSSSDLDYLVGKLADLAPRAAVA